MNLHIETARLLIRPFRHDDAREGQALWREVFGAELSPERLTWMSLAPGELTALHQPPIGDRAICLHNGSLVGAVGLTASTGPYDLVDAPPSVTEVPWRVEIGLFWALRPAERGNGYATEAAAALVEALFAATPRLHRVVAHTEHDNRPSRRVMERLGMTVKTFHDVADAPWFQVIGTLKRRAP